MIINTVWPPNPLQSAPPPDAGRLSATLNGSFRSKLPTASGTDCAFTGSVSRRLSPMLAERQVSDTLLTKSDCWSNGRSGRRADASDTILPHLPSLDPCHHG